MSKISVKNETKEEKFKRIASARTLRILNDLRLLGNCSSTGTYSYTEDDTNKIFFAIEKEVKRIKILFNKSETKFSLE